MEFLQWSQIFTFYKADGWFKMRLSLDHRKSKKWTLAATTSHLSHCSPYSCPSREWMAESTLLGLLGIEPMSSWSSCQCVTIQQPNRPSSIQMVWPAQLPLHGKLHWPVNMGIFRGSSESSPPWAYLGVQTPPKWICSGNKSQEMHNHSPKSM